MAEVSRVVFEILIRLPGQDMTNIITAGSVSMTEVEDGLMIDRSQLAAALREAADNLDNNDEVEDSNG